MTAKSFVERHALVFYFLLMFLISWLGSYLVAGTRLLRGESLELREIGLMAIPMLGAPFGVGILMSYRIFKGSEPFFALVGSGSGGGKAQ